MGVAATMMMMLAGRRRLLQAWCVVAATTCTRSYPLQQYPAVLRPQPSFRSSRLFCRATPDTSAAASPHHHEIVRQRTIEWLKTIVIGLNLCPFADLPFRQNQVKIDILDGDDHDFILQKVLDELVYRRDAHGTTLIVCPDLHPERFLDFWELASFIENTVIAENPQLRGHVLLASFHPYFVFGGSEVDSCDNYTNRSPYPIFHILRDEEVSRAADQLDGDAAKVWRRNIDLLTSMRKELGTENFEKVMTLNVNQKKTDDKELDTMVKEILRRFRTSKQQSGDANR